MTHVYTLQITIAYRPVFSVTFFAALLCNVFQQFTLLCSRPYVLAGWWPSHTNLLLSYLPSHNSSWPLCSLLTDHTGKTSSNGFIVACVSVTVIAWQLLGRCLAIGVFSEPFPSNGSLLVSQFWLSADMPQYHVFTTGQHPVSLFQHTCHSIMYSLQANILSPSFSRHATVSCIHYRSTPCVLVSAVCHWTIVHYCK
jgi:hypothetical protein